MASTTARGAARADIKKQTGFTRRKDAANFIVTNRGRNAYVHGADGTTANVAVGSAAFIARTSALRAADPTHVADEIAENDAKFPNCGWGEALTALTTDAGELVVV